MVKKYLPQIAYPLTVFILWRVLILLFQIFLQPYYKVTDDSLTVWQRVFVSWTTYWDTGHYLSIAQHGYHYPQQAFFPLWPLFIKMFSFFIPIGLSVYILTFLLSLTVFILFYLLAKRLVGEEKAKFSLIIFCAFPSTMFLLAGYTEALFLTLVLSSFLFLEKKMYLQSAILGGLAGMTRLVGVILIIPHLLVKKPTLQKIFYAVVVSLGIIFYIFYLKLNYSDPLYFLHAQTSWCSSQGRCSINFPLKPLIDYGYLILIGWVKPSLSPAFIDWFSAVMFLLGSIAVLKILGQKYFIYSVLVILPSLFSGITVGMVRYVLIAFPVFFVAPLLIKSKLIFLLISLIFLLLQLRFVTLFTSRIWVA